MIDIIIIIVIIAIVSLVDFSFMFLNEELIRLLYITDDQDEKSSDSADSMNELHDSTEESEESEEKSLNECAADNSTIKENNEFTDEFAECDNDNEAPNVQKINQSVIDELDEIIQGTMPTNEHSNGRTLSKEELDRQSDELTRMVMEEIL